MRTSWTSVTASARACRFSSTCWNGPIADAGDECAFLLQQPEVHLHPRGQAELASLFVQAFKQSGNRFLIETHSDYIVDRVRISVRKGLLKPDDVSILYFEPRGSAVAVHDMTLDEHGNLLDCAERDTVTSS